MISEFVREQKRYTQGELCDILQLSEDRTVPIIRKLKEFGVLKAVKSSFKQQDMSELLEEEVEVADVEPGEDEYLYVFTYVGVIAAAGRVLKCCPKYLLKTEKPVEPLAQVMEVLERYNSKEQTIRMFNESSESSSFNLLAVMLFLLQDYYENGIYSNTYDIIETNGSGEILWGRTIDETFTMLCRNRPYYPELQTKRRIVNDLDYFKRLHECVLTACSKELKSAGLLDIFKLTEMELTEEELEDFGDRDTMLYNIEKELNTQFNTRKQLVLKTLYAYIYHGGSLYDTDCLSLLGTNSFNIIWEKVCAEVFDNQLNTTLEKLSLPIPLKPEEDGKIKLIDLIEKPMWTATGMTAVDTLIPDLVSIVTHDNGTWFVIFDAKYYNARLVFGTPPKAQPGIESVTKQYLYQAAYREFIEDHGFSAVKNCFLLPTEEDRIVDGGEVSMQMLNCMGLQDIKVRFLPAGIVFEHYLAGKHFDISLLHL